MTYTESIDFLYGLQKFGMKFGLRGIRNLLSFLDHPEKQFPSIHIAGTNGKGSTASMIASVFTAAGYKTGLYTSPHLVSFNERIRIDGKKISSRAVARLTSAIRSEVEKNNCTFFEAVTAIAFNYFAESAVDIAVVETGLGGRLDATNVLQPLVSVITTVGLEHTRILGTTVKDIAFEKGGIIKKGIPCVSGVRPQKAIRVLKKICDQKKSQFIQLHAQSLRIRHSLLDGLVVDFCIGSKYLKNIQVSLAGEFQAMNALIAIKAVEVVNLRSSFIINDKSIRDGLRKIQKFSGIQARLSVIRRKPLVIADVAHNPDAIRSICDSLCRMHLGKMYVVLGLMEDKNYMQIISEIQKITKAAFLVEARTERSRRTPELAREFRRYGINVEEFNNVLGGVKSAFRKCNKRAVLLTGSHFVVGEALAYFTGEKYLTISQ